MSIIINNLILKKILSYCWEFDNKSKLFYWNRNYTIYQSQDDSCYSEHNKRICKDALNWKLSLMTVSSTILKIILSNFSFRLNEEKLNKIEIEVNENEKKEENEIKKLFKNQIFNSMTLDFDRLLNFYETFGKETFIKTFSNIQNDCLLIITNSESLVNDYFFNIISMIGINYEQDHDDDNNINIVVNKKLKITLIFNCEEIQYGSSNLLSTSNREELFKNYKNNYDLLLLNSTSKSRSSLNIDTLIVNYAIGSSNDVVIRVVSYIFYLACESIKNVYAFNQPHLTHLPYYIKDFKNVKTIYLHTDCHQTYGRFIYNDPESSGKKLNDLTFSIDFYDHEEEYQMQGYSDFYYKDYSPKNISHLIVSKDITISDFLSGCTASNGKDHSSSLESFSFKTNKLDSPFFRHQCIETQSRPASVIGNPISIPSSLINLSIEYFQDLKTPIPETLEAKKSFQTFSSFFKHDSIINTLKYFSLVISFYNYSNTRHINSQPFSETLNKFSLCLNNIDCLLKELFKNGLSNVNSLEYISISFKQYEDNQFTFNQYSNLFIKIIQYLKNSKNIKGILFENINVGNLNNLPIEIDNFIKYPFKLNNSIYYYLK